MATYIASPVNTGADWTAPPNPALHATLPVAMIERLRASSLNTNQATGYNRGRSHHVADLNLPAQLSGLNLECIEKSVFASYHRNILVSCGRRRDTQPGLILPAHRAGTGIKGVEVKVFRSNQDGVANDRRRGVDAVSRRSAPYRLSG